MKAEDYKKAVVSDSFFPDYSITSVCNLNCVGCRMYTSIAKPWFVSLEQIEADILHLKRIGIHGVSLFGGEPTVHPKLKEIIELFSCHDIKVGILTNGKNFSRLPFKTYATMRKHNVVISFTMYPKANINYQLNEKVCKAFHIEYNYFNTAMSVIEQSLLSPSGKYDKLEQWNWCNSVWPIIQAGKLFICIAAVNIDQLNNKFGTHIRHDYLELKDIKDFEQFKEYTTNPIEFCRYCGADDNPIMNKVIPWRKSEGKAEEWLNLNE